MPSRLFAEGILGLKIGGDFKELKSKKSGVLIYEKEVAIGCVGRIEWMLCDG